MKSNLIFNRNQRVRSGLTLIEMLVVLVILVALAGILVPLLPNVMTRAHGAAGAENIAEVARGIQSYEALYNAHPNEFDSLLDESDAVVVGAGDLQAVTDLDATPTGKRIADALTRVGIDTSYEHLSTTTNQTFAPYDEPAVINTITYDAANDTATGKATTLTALGIASLALEPVAGSTADGVQAYVAFGVGSRSTMIGKSMVDAPVHFPESGEDPSDVYSRMLVVYAVPAEGPARLACVCAAHDDGLSGLNTHLLEYYETVEQ